MMAGQNALGQFMQDYFTLLQLGVTYIHQSPKVVMQSDLHKQGSIIVLVLNQYLPVMEMNPLMPGILCMLCEHMCRASTHNKNVLAATAASCSLPSDILPSDIYRMFEKLGRGNAKSPS